MGHSIVTGAEAFALFRVFRLECGAIESGHLGLSQFPLVIQGVPEAEACPIDIQMDNERGEGAFMSDVFFNFVNEPTYYVFEWVRGGGLGDVSRLIARAYEKAEHSPWLQMGEDVCRVVRDALADLLRDGIVYKVTFHSEGLEEIGGTAMPLQVGLTYPLLTWAMQQIRFHIVAEALLRDARKWNPGPVRPTAINS